jgi:predicted metalloprotease with PDZ domain
MILPPTGWEAAVSKVKWTIAGSVVAALSVLALFLVGIILVARSFRLSGNAQGPIGIVVGDIPTNGLMGVDLASNQDGGEPVVQHVLPGSGAEAAGVRVDDVITRADGRAVTSVDDWKRVVASKKPGEVLDLDVRRDGVALTFQVTLISFEDMIRLREAEGRALKRP